ncbi:MAG: AI-2E family transporter [Nanoarchaeota archaeon]|nr:AI-2E family transporter [Nanoarchaeota archaeon]
MIKIVVQYKFYIENPEVLNEIVSNFLQTVTDSSILTNVSFSNLLTPIVSFIIDTSNNFFSSIPKTVFYFFIVLFISYYVLIFNKKILNVVNVYLPLGLKKQNEILINVTKNIRILFKGYFLTAIIQTGVAFLGYLAFGVPNILLITFVTLILSLIPYLGTPIVWVPLGFYLILIGEEIAGIGLLIYGTFVISMIDNFLRPVLMSDKETLSPPVVFVGFIGGMIAFGIEGLILGPMILSVTVIFLRYLKEAYEIKVDGE